MIKPISISLSPNTEPDDIWLAFGLWFQPWKWKTGRVIEDLEKKFAKKIGIKHAYSFNSGRSSFMAILEAFNFEKGSEILLQAFTCNAVPNPVIWSDLKPIYVDCNGDDYNVSVEDLERKITSKSKAVVVQHTFGIPADLDRIIEICKKHNLILIEDCAHALGAIYKGRQVGTFGDAAFFSFSRDKVISSVYGGMAVTNNDAAAEKIRKIQKEIEYPSFGWIFQQLMHPVKLNWEILPTYRLLGKYILVIDQKLHILSKAVHWKEKRGEKPDYFPKALPNALALLAERQLEKLGRFNSYRKELAAWYEEQLRGTSFELLRDFQDRESIFLRYPVKHPKAHEIITNAWKENILIGDWYTNAVAPDDTILEKLQYKAGSCPTAEKLALITLNLPTHINISKKHAQIVIDVIKKYGD